MPLEDWKRNARGMIFAHPLSGFESSASGLAVAWRIEWSEPQAGGHRRKKSVQLSLPPEAALEIGEEIVRTAKLHMGRQPDGSA